MPDLRVLEIGEPAILVEFEDLDAVLAHFRALDADRPTGVLELVPAARTLLIRFDRRATRRDTVVDWVRSATPKERAHREPGAELEIRVRYDGPDLEDVAELTGLGVEGLISAHTSTVWTVAFSGFAPGFGYLAGDAPELRVPRRSTPRTSVPAGAVGLAGRFTGIYPRSSPGGWQLIGSTREPLWNIERTPPALLRPGLVVRFEREEQPPHRAGPPGSSHR